MLRHLINGPGDRVKGVPSFGEMEDFALVEVDFDDPTTNVRGRHVMRTSIQLLHPQPLLLYILDQLLELAHAN